MPDKGLQQCARDLQDKGELSEKRGDLTVARQQFIQARRMTMALLAAKPNDPKRIFDQAQSEYWVGFINWQNGDGAAAKVGLEAYASLVDRLLKIDPKNRAWRAEAGYAESNLGTLALRQAGDLPGAERYFAAALATFQTVAGTVPSDVGAQLDLADGYAWLADCQRLQNKLREAAESRQAERRLLNRLAESDPRNTNVHTRILYNELAVARIEADRGHLSTAVAELDASRVADAEKFAQNDPTNIDIVKQLRALEIVQGPHPPWRCQESGGLKPCGTSETSQAVPAE